MEKFIGDAVMAVWSAHNATEDDPERAVRAALDLVAAVTALGDEIGVPDLRVRAGVLTGEATVTVGAVLTSVGETAEPHRLCAYLFDVASLFTTFYEECPVLKAEPASLRVSRLALCALTLDVLTLGLTLLGVPIPERM